MKVISSMWMHLSTPPRQRKRATNDHDYALSKTTGRPPPPPPPPLPGQVNSNLKAHNADNADNVVRLAPPHRGRQKHFYLALLSFSICLLPPSSSSADSRRADCLKQLSKMNWGKDVVVAVLLSAFAVKNNKY